MLTLHERYIEDENGRKVAVALPVAEYVLLRERLARLEAVVAALEAETQRVAVLLETARQEREADPDWEAKAMRAFHRISDDQIESLKAIYDSLAEEEVALAEMGLQEWADGLDDEPVVAGAAQ